MRKLLLPAIALGALMAGIAVAQQNKNGKLELGSSTTPVYINGETRMRGVLVGDHATGSLVVDGGMIITGDLKIQNARALVALPGDGGVPTVLMQFGQSTLSSGTLGVTFPTAFSGVPICTCSDTASTAAAANCNAASTSGVTLKGDTTAHVNWICVGAK